MMPNRQVLIPLSNEFRFVAACSWLPSNATRQSDLVASIAPDSLDWNKVVELVVRHGLAELFSQALLRCGRTDVPKAVTDLLKGLRQQQAGRSLGLAAELARIEKLFNGAGIDVIPLKGVALSQELYGNPAVRNSGDLDILVRPEDVAKAQELLEHLGYRHALGFTGMGARQQQHILKNLHHHEYFLDSRGVMVELHWRGYLWSAVQVARLWESCNAPHGSDTTTRHLSHLDNILFLADHGARHGWESLKWLSDLAMLLENATEDEWLVLYDRAQCFDLQRVLLQTAQLVERFYGIVPPAKIRELCAADRSSVTFSRYAAHQLLASREELALQVRHFAGVRQMFRIKLLKPATPLSELVRNLMIKPEDFLEFPLPERLYWLYLLLRPYLWYRRHYLTRRG